MTVRLDQIMKARDFQVAEDVGKMAALGWIDTEFTMYGCGYLVGDLPHYLISNDANNIYDFIDGGTLSGVYPTPMVSLSKKCPVPSGQKEAIARQVKIELAEEIRRQYPADFLRVLANLGSAQANDGAKELLLTLQEKLTGLFVEDLLQIFESLVSLAYEHKVLGDEARGEFMAWLYDVRKDMMDDVVVKDIFERTFYGFAYEEGLVIKYYSNTLRETVYARQKEIADEGFVVTPIFWKTYWYNYNYRLDDAKKDYQKYLCEVFGEAYFTLIKEIMALPGPIERAVYWQTIAYAQASFGSTAQNALISYGRKWHLLHAGGNLEDGIFGNER